MTRGLYRRTMSRHVHEQQGVHHCKLAMDVNEELFWEKAKVWVKKCLVHHRSDKATTFRNVFHGKSTFVISILFKINVC